MASLGAKYPNSDQSDYAQISRHIRYGELKEDPALCRVHVNHLTTRRTIKDQTVSIGVLTVRKFQGTGEQMVALKHSLLELILQLGMTSDVLLFAFSSLEGLTHITGIMEEHCPLTEEEVLPHVSNLRAQPVESEYLHRIFYRMEADGRIIFKANYLLNYVNSETILLDL